MFVCSCEQVHVCMPVPLQLHSLFYLRETDVLTVSSLRHLSLYPSSPVVHLSLRSGGLDRKDFWELPTEGSHPPPCTAHCSRHFLSRFSGFACSLLWHLSISWIEIFLKLLTSLLCPASECKDPTSETKFLSTFLFHSCLAPFIPPNTNLESRIPFSPGGRPQKLECYYCLRANHKA